MDRHWIAKWLVGLMVGCFLVATDFETDFSHTGISTVSAQQNVTVSPTRVVFEDRDRSRELILVNRGGEAVTYRISLIGMKMTERGSLERIEEPEENQEFAHNLLRFAPRQVHLEPGDTQRIRVSVRKPADLEEGEYRSHMMFRAVPDADEGADFEVEDEEEMALRLNVMTGISIPMIVRHGQLSADMEMRDLELAEGDGEHSRVRMSLHRDGERSVYGDINVDFIPDESVDSQDDEPNQEPEPIRIGRRSGTAVYTPNDLRHVELPVELPDEISLDDGRILVTYESDGGETLTSGEIGSD